MAHPLPVRLLPFSLVSLALLFAGCCANNVCDCNDAQQDAIALRFSRDLSASGRGFTDADLDTIVFQRYPLPYVPSGRFESVTLFRGASTGYDSTIVLNNGTPFLQVGSNKLNHYRYVVQYLAHPVGATGVPVKRGVPSPVLVIDTVRLQGSLDGSGCCTCYSNTRKAIYRDGNLTEILLKPNNHVLIAKP